MSKELSQIARPKKENERLKKENDLLKKISRIYWESGGRYGSPRIHKRLQDAGIYVGEKRVERLMRNVGLQARVFRVTRSSVGIRRRYAQRSNEVWVTDVTYLKVKSRWLYLATVMDLNSRRIIGWSPSHTRNTALMRAALTYAFRKRDKPEGVVIHSDRGAEYLGSKYQALLERYGMKQSFNRPGQCPDNASMDLFYHSLKGELIRGSIFRNEQHLRKSLVNYINNFYNPIRLQSGIEYVSPIEYEVRSA